MERIKKYLTARRNEVIDAYKALENPTITIKAFFESIFNHFAEMDEEEADRLACDIDLFNEELYCAMAEAEDMAGYDWHKDAVKTEELTAYEKKAYAFYQDCKSDSYFAKIYGYDLLKKFQEI